MPKTMEDLKAKIMASVEKIPKQEIIKSNLAMRKRAEKVIKLGGLHIK